jgi:hypothetical protein
MRYLLLSIATLLLPFAASADDSRTPVVVELFTSEGCSSCPPADDLLLRLERTQPVGGARVIALEEHVDYWNSLGWVDPFSAPQFRFRQNDFARRDKNDNVYTPQMIVGGQQSFVGNDGPRAQQEIQRAAAQQPAAAVSLKAAPNPRNREAVDLNVEVRDLRGPRADGPCDVYLAVTESNLSTNVARGENSGRLLRHAPVVRSINVIGKLDAARPGVLQLTPALELPKTWKRENLRAIVFVEERSTQRITGAATLDMPR